MIYSGQRKQSDTAYGLCFMLIRSDDHITGLTGASATVVVSLSKNGTTGSAPVGVISEVDATNLPGLYKIAGNATDSNTLGSLFLHAKDTDSDPFDGRYDIVSFDPYITQTTIQTQTNKMNFIGTDIKATLDSELVALAIEQHVIVDSGTVTTTTNLTNAPTVGDLTDTMKASINAEVDIALNTAIPGSPTADSINERIATMDGTTLSTVATTVAKLDTALEADAAVYRFTLNSLELAPTGGSAPTAAAIADAVCDELLSGHVVSGSLGATISAIESPTGTGSGTLTYTVTSSVDATPIAGVYVWVTSDIGGTNTKATGTTDASGSITFCLDTGTVYVWRQKSGYTFANPDTETVS